MVFEKIKKTTRMEKEKPNKMTMIKQRNKQTSTDIIIFVLCKNEMKRKK